MARCDGAKQMGDWQEMVGEEEPLSGGVVKSENYGGHEPDWAQDEAATAGRGSPCLGGCSRSTQGPLASSSLGLW